VKKTVSGPAKSSTKDPLECVHSKLATSDNAEIHEPSVHKYAAASPTVAASSGERKPPSPPVAEVRTTTRGISTSGSDE
ncbi:hypothetical protein ZWY2020_008654, partial [Hordeum vulgare]